MGSPGLVVGKGDLCIATVQGLLTCDTHPQQAEDRVVVHVQCALAPLYSNLLWCCSPKEARPAPFMPYT